MKKIFIILLLFFPFIAKASFDSNLEYGLKKDPRVKELQEFLAEEGLYMGPISGNFFSLTSKAVRDFQKREKITPMSGVFGPKTRQRANTILNQNTTLLSKQSLPLPIVSTPPLSIELTSDTDSIMVSLQDRITLLTQKVTDNNLRLQSFKVASTFENGDRFILQQEINIQNLEIQYLRSLIQSLENKEDISADAYMVIDVETGKVILKKNIEKTYPIASVTKLMNAVVVLENANKKNTITLTKNILKPEGQSPALFLNLKTSVGNLLKASLTQSVNDAAQALSYAVDPKRFIDLMNKKSKALNMKHTKYYDAHGLNPKNTSTASDLVKLAQYIYQNHLEILEISKDNAFWLPDHQGRLLKFKNLNHFYLFSNFIGGKTGYLIEAKETMVSLFTINKKPIIIVVLYSDNVQADTLKLFRLAESSMNPH